MVYLSFWFCWNNNVFHLIEAVWCGSKKNWEKKWALARVQHTESSTKTQWPKLWHALYFKDISGGFLEEYLLCDVLSDWERRWVEDEFSCRMKPVPRVEGRDGIERDSCVPTV